MTVFCEECKYLPNCELAKHEEVDTCKNGKKCCEEQKDYCVRNDMSCKDCPSNMEEEGVGK